MKEAPPFDQAVAQWQRWRSVLADERLPCAVIDLDAVEHNARILAAALPSPGPTVRLASKSLRCPALIRHILGLDPRFVGLLTMNAAETRALFELGVDDLFLAYPASRPEEAADLATIAAAGGTLLATVDSAAHVDLLDTAARAAGTVIPVAIDLDLSLPLLGQHLGVRRSPVRDAAAALALARHIDARPGTVLRGVLAYEAQVAGIPDHVRGGALLDPIRGLIKQRSIPLARQRRAELLAALGPLPVVNGGGTGSLPSTGLDPSVTEVTAGSGFLCPHLFDGYDGLPLRPAAFFALAVCRQSDPGFVTCYGGGYPASGPGGADRSPLPWLPPGLRTVELEGFGEVQTPLRTADCPVPLQLGDPVLCRHAKAGELADRFPELLLVRGDRILTRAPTLRALPPRPIPS